MRIAAPVALATFLLSACGVDDPTTLAQATGEGVKVPVTQPGGNTSKHVVLDSRVDGAAVSFEVFEPKTLEVGRTYPLILEGHGYGGSRQKPATAGGPPAAGSFIERLTNAGYYVISIDERGFGESGGTVRSMSPDFEGQDLVQILDWAEDLPGLRRRANGEMLVGSYGGSYGGMYQGLLLGADPRQRLRVLAPDITPHDLSYSLDPYNVVKSGYGLALAGAGEAGAQNNPSDPNPANGQDPVIFETLIQATLTNAFSETSKNMFTYHSYAYFCDGKQPGPQDFVVASGDPLGVAPRPFAQADVLFTQGFRDTLFNFNEAYANYQCLKARGGDVRLLTHQSGHILPASLTSVPGAEKSLDPFYAAITAPNFQDAGGSRSCGSLVLNDVQFAWFEEKLQGKAGAVAATLKSGTNVCLSLAEGDAVSVAEVMIGGQRFDLDASIPQFSSVLGVGGATLGNGAREALLATQVLYTAPAGGAVVAGIPKIAVEMTGLSGAEPSSCTVPLSLGACDPILFAAIGWQRAGETRWDIVDDQLTPMRGFGTHAVDMGGIAERLAEGDRLALLVFGFHAQFPVTWSRDIAVPALDLSGHVELPILAPSQIAQSGL